MSSFLNDMSPPAGAQGYDSSDDDGACIGGVSQLRPAAQRLSAAAAGGLGGASQRDAMKELRCAEMNIWSERLALSLVSKSAAWSVESSLVRTGQLLVAQVQL